MFALMNKHDRNSLLTLPIMLTRLGMASWETIMHRTVLMATGACSAAEYQRMTLEKVAAAQASMLALAQGKTHAAVLAPYVSRSRANARRLRGGK